MTLETAKNFPENLPPLWREQLSQEQQETYFQKLTRFLKAEYSQNKKIYPERQWILRALQAVDFDQVKVVILGQDPYHGPGQAIGLSFGVPNEHYPKPPSLKNIFKELKSDLGVEIPDANSDLTGWASQGVLLLNTVLTVRESEAFSHKDAGWEQFTDRVIAKLNGRSAPMVFILWGAAAQKKKLLITNPRHRILESVHPSPLSAHRGFFGSRPFSRANKILVQELGLPAIEWEKTSLK